MARCHRLGQARPVRVYRLVTARSYEAKLLELANVKLALDHALLGAPDAAAERACGGGSRAQQRLSPSELEALIRYGAHAALAAGSDASAAEALARFEAADFAELLQTRAQPRETAADPTAPTPAPPAVGGGLAALCATRCEPAVGAEQVAVDDPDLVAVDDPDFWAKLLPGAEAAIRLRAALLEQGGRDSLGRGARGAARRAGGAADGSAARGGDDGSAAADGGDSTASDEPPPSAAARGTQHGRAAARAETGRRSEHATPPTPPRTPARATRSRPTTPRESAAVDLSPPSKRLRARSGDAPAAAAVAGRARRGATAAASGAAGPTSPLSPASRPETRSQPASAGKGLLTPHKAPRDELPCHGSVRLLRPRATYGLP
jgi:hypothetical protein